MSSNPIGKEFWETKHSDNERWWISGTSVDTMLNQHNLKWKAFKNKKILEIGVGTRSMTEQLSGRASALYCCDISQTALDNVSQYATKTFLTENLKDIPGVDIAFSHLVFQHCCDEEIFRIINDVNLLDDGIFSFEFVSTVDDVIIDKVQQFIDEGTHFLEV